MLQCRLSPLGGTLLNVDALLLLLLLQWLEECEGSSTPHLLTVPHVGIAETQWCSIQALRHSFQKSVHLCLGMLHAYLRTSGVLRHWSLLLGPYNSHCICCFCRWAACQRQVARSGRDLFINACSMLRISGCLPCWLCMKREKVGITDDQYAATLAEHVAAEKAVSTRRPMVLQPLYATRHCQSWKAVPIGCKLQAVAGNWAPSLFARSPCIEAYIRLH